jgi:hypothetical protein
MMKSKFTLATKCQHDVLRTEIESPFHVHIVFIDQSEFVFRAVLGSPQPNVVGAPDSLAVTFRGQAQTFIYLAAGVMIRFEDGSSCSLNFGQKIAAQPPSPELKAAPKLVAV